MYVFQIDNSSEGDWELYEMLRDAWNGVDYAGLPEFDAVLPDIADWVRGIGGDDTVWDGCEYRVCRLLWFDSALDMSNTETAVAWLSAYGYVSREFCGVGYSIPLTDGHGALTEMAVIQYAINLILGKVGDGRYVPILDDGDYERRETEWLRDFFDGEVTDGMLHGVDRDAVFWAWRDMTDATSGDCDFNAAMLPEYLKSAEGTAHHA